MRRSPACFPLVLIALAIVTGGCGSESVPTAPNVLPSTPQAPLTVTSVGTPVSFAGTTVIVFGTGFIAGAQVRLGALAAPVSSLADKRIVVTTPPEGSGTVDVVVTNPDGQSATLPAALTYNAVTLHPSRTVLAPGDEVTVTWTAAAARCSLDWIGMYVRGTNNANYGPWSYTSCGTSGTVRLNAPAVRGQYEFRYLLDDGVEDVARSVTVTVE